MATNVNLSYPNFTLTSQAGTFGTINMDAATTIFRIKNTSGGLISDYTLSANIHPGNQLVGIEYCGPLNTSEMVDGSTFFTVERIPDRNYWGTDLGTSSECLVKRWEVDTSFSQLNLKKEITKYTTGNYYYDLNGMSVEHYHRTFTVNQYYGKDFVDMSSATHIESGDTLFLGPSSNAINPGATENVSVSHVVGNRVYLNSFTNYFFAAGDKITFFKNVYLISKKGIGGDTRFGTMFTIDAYSGDFLGFHQSGEYARITTARWSSEVGAVAVVNRHQLLFIRPHYSYQKWKSMFLNNIASNNSSYFEVYDVIFDQFNVYKLMRKATTKDDLGNKTTDSWATYNYQQDTLLPYTHNVAIYMKQQYTVGFDETRIYLQTRDQFGVGLRDVNVNLYHDGADLGAYFDPLNGQAITDKDGKADIGYIPGGHFTGPIVIEVRVDKSSAHTGSQYCWNSILIDNKMEFSDSFGRGAMFQKFAHGDKGRLNQIPDPFQHMGLARDANEGADLELISPAIYLDCRSFFTAPGGNWTSIKIEDTKDCWPWFQTVPKRGDRPPGQPTKWNTMCTWDCITWPPVPEAHEEEDTACVNTDKNVILRSGYIKQVLEFTQVGVPPDYYIKFPLDPEAESLSRDGPKPLYLPQVTDFWQYNHDMSCDFGPCDLEDGKPIPFKMKQLDSENWMRFSQLNLSKHSHWVDGVHTKYLTTNARLDQFIFVEDAIPGFWSEKNARETNIWIRMRPFAFSLDGDTLKFYVREVWTVDDKHYDTGYYNVIDKYGWPPNNDRVTLEYFDAGGGNLGIEFTYDNPDIYQHNALVFIHIEVYDTAAEPNYIYTDYWFKVIPDYKSPYLENESPDREEDQVPIDTSLYFEVKDHGAGVDIDTLEVFLNSRIVYHAGQPNNPATIVEEVSVNHYKVTMALPYELQYGKEYSVGVRVSDISENKNMLRDSYKFYTRHGEVPWFTNFDPKLCKRGMPRFRDVAFLVLGGGQGVDKETIRIQVHNKDVTKDSKIIPVIYRIS